MFEQMNFVSSLLPLIYSSRDIFTLRENKTVKLWAFVPTENFRLPLITRRLWRTKQWKFKKKVGLITLLTYRSYQVLTVPVIL